MKKIAISDIHGCAKTFAALLHKINLTKKDNLYLLGDYIDRGPDSKGVIDMIFDLKAKGFQVECLIGNHEVMLLESFANENNLENWLFNGGKQALQSFGVHSIHDIPQRYIQFFQSLHYHLTIDKYILVHAGLDFSYADPLYNKEMLVWVRKWYQSIQYNWLHNRTIVHGHTPIAMSDIQMMHKTLHRNQYINIDAGCVFVDYASQGLGNLCAFNLNTQEITFQRNIDC
jgi:serine/threonine protein phosphatase 1